MFRWANGTVEPLVGDEPVTAILRDREGHIWSGGRPALYRLAATLIENHTVPEDRHQMAISLAQAEDGRVCFTTVQGLWEVAADGGIRYQSDKPGAPRCVRGLAARPGGGFLLAACAEGVMHFDGASFSRIAGPLANPAGVAGPP